MHPFPVWHLQYHCSPVARMNVGFVRFCKPQICEVLLVSSWWESQITRDLNYCRKVDLIRMKQIKHISGLQKQFHQFILVTNHYHDTVLSLADSMNHHVEKNSILTSLIHLCSDTSHWDNMTPMLWCFWKCVGCTRKIQWMMRKWKYFITLMQCRFFFFFKVSADIVCRVTLCNEARGTKPNQWLCI